MGWYWVIDPDDATLTVWRLEGASYALEATVAGEDAYQGLEPVVIEVRPASLVRAMRR